MAGLRFNRKGERVKKRPRITMKSSGKARPGEKTPTVNNPPSLRSANVRKGGLPKKKKERIKIVPGFKGLINKRKELIN